MIFGEFFSPILFAFLFWYIGYTFNEGCRDPNTGVISPACKATTSIWIPYVLMMIVPQVSNINARFIIQNIVEDKMNKVRETLQLMSLSRFSYAMSYFLSQSFFALIQAAIISIGFFNNDIYWPVNPIGASFGAFFAIAMLFMG